MRRTLGRIALWLIHAGVAAAIAMQLVRDDIFPPTNSLSQYGVGPGGWVFTLAVALLGVGSLTLVAAANTLGPGPRRFTSGLIATWGVGLILMGIVPADPTQTVVTASGRIHLVVATISLIALPLGAMLWIVGERSGAAYRRRIVVCTLALISWASLILLVLAGNHVDITGFGSRAEWSFYQTVAIVLDIAIVYLLTTTVTRPLPVRENLSRKNDAMA